MEKNFLPLLKETNSVLLVVSRGRNLDISSVGFRFFIRLPKSQTPIALLNFQLLTPHPIPSDPKKTPLSPSLQTQRKNSNPQGGGGKRSDEKKTNERGI